MLRSDPDLRRSAVALARRPSLWPSAAVAAGRHLPTEWWRGPASVRAAAPWIRFRLETAYGTERTSPTAADLVTWLRWLRSWPRPPH